MEVAEPSVGGLPHFIYSMSTWFAQYPLFYICLKLLCKFKISKTILNYCVRSNQQGCAALFFSIKNETGAKLLNDQSTLFKSESSTTNGEYPVFTIHYCVDRTDKNTVLRKTYTCDYAAADDKRCVINVPDYYYHETRYSGTRIKLLFINLLTCDKTTKNNDSKH
uniref:Uncharacterized protein n=1 Tax=Romanomermis culicivorax TaxID=13658 RepID=A0A915HLE7_ROMCU